VRAQLLNRNGGSGANFASTVFDDFSDTAIGSGAAPFTGTFRPAQPLGYFTGLSGSQVNGTWTLELHDNAGADTGTLNSWSLSFEAGEPFAITDSNGSYAFYNFAGNYSLTEEHQPGWHPTLPTLGSYYVPNFASGTSYGGAPFLVTADSSIPTATIALAGPTPTNAASVQFTVDFSESVFRVIGNAVSAGPSTANFAVEAFGAVSGASVTTVALLSGNSYTVTVNTGTGDGAIRLVLNSSDLVDAGFNPVVAPVFSTLVTIDKTAPTASVVIGDGTAQRSRVTSLTVNFSEVISYVGLPTAAFTLERTVGGVPTGTVSFTVSTTILAGHSVATINFTSDTAFGSLTDGHYRLTVIAGQVRDTAGNFIAGNVVQDFHRFFGDANGDEHVDIVDFGLFSSTFNLNNSQPGFLPYFDFNNDGQIDIVDFGQFSIRIFTVLP
jgi:hypothetical protein